MTSEVVARLLTAGLQGAPRWRASWGVPSTAAIWKARSRLGVAPLRQVFERVCRPVAAPGTHGAFYRRWRLTAIDGTLFDLPDTKANVKAFGRPTRSGRGEQNVGYPQIRMVGLVECGTHAVFDAAIGALRTGEQTLARTVPSLRTGMLLADRGFYSVDSWCKAAVTGADLLRRVRKDLVPPAVEQLLDGSYLTEIFDRSDIQHTRRGVPVRAVEYSITGREGVYRLSTTISTRTRPPSRGTGRTLRPAWGVRIHPR
ncbi:transposase domain-containing protein [Streptomyces sp. NPDC052023]|uniref:transposase domain-containing protein n=1 Tax=Streptomyces sp. NPDC052023 TaxID=3365681 RepID=UPI0037CD34DF